MNSEPDSATVLLERLNGTKIETRFLTLAAFFALFLGFVLLVAYLELQREQEVHKSAEYKRQIEVLKATIVAANLSAASSAAETSLGATREDTIRYLRSAAAQAVALDQTATVVPVGQIAIEELSASPVTMPIRLFIQIADESQRKAARALELRLEALKLGSRPIVVPGIELTPIGGDDTVRCLKVVDCRDVNALADLVNGQLSSPQFGTINLSRRYDRDPRIVVGNFELWFSKTDEIRPK